MSKFTDISGNKYGRLTAEVHAGRDGTHTYWWFLCDCGNRCRKNANNVKTGHTKSCGCMAKEGNNLSHGGRKSPEYRVWAAVVQRCTNKNNPAYKDYGLRGITISDSWLEFSNFIADMGPRPSDEHTVERKDNSAGYSADNCIWDTRTVQGRNKRNNLVLEFRGKSQCLSEWCEELNMAYDTVQARLKYYGWGVEKALTTPCPSGYTPSRDRKVSTES